MGYVVKTILDEATFYSFCNMKVNVFYISLQSSNNWYHIQCISLNNKKKDLKKHLSLPSKIESHLQKCYWNVSSILPNLSSIPLPLNQWILQSNSFKTIKYLEKKASQMRQWKQKPKITLGYKILFIEQTSIVILLNWFGLKDSFWDMVNRERYSLE